MTYNRFLYNTALYNAGREEVGAIARSIIQAHTGPHIQAVVGGTGGVSFLSDFRITEGSIRKPPSRFKFPDLTAWIRATRAQRQDVIATIRGYGFKDLPAALFPTDHIPDLAARIFGLFEANLLAAIVGQLGQTDLAAIINITVADLAAQMLGVAAPTIRGTIFAQEPGNLGARIHTPLDLPALLTAVNKGDLAAVLAVLQKLDLPGQMLGIPAPQISSFIRAFSPGIRNLPSRTAPIVLTDLPASLTSSIPGPDDVSGSITSTGGFTSLQGLIRSITESTSDLAATIQQFSSFDLPAVVSFLGSGILGSAITASAVGERDKFLNAALQSVHPADLGATMTLSENVDFLGATIQALRERADLGAFIRVAETFVTAILTVSTMASSSLRATIGNPSCAGGSANANLAAYALAQHRGDLRAAIESYITGDLGAAINTSETFFAFDTIDISFSPAEIINTIFNVTDTIAVSFSPFRGRNLGATVTAVQNNVSLGASITAAFPLPRVVPAISRLTAADLRLDHDLNLQEITLQLEGSLLEYIYVNGTEQAFIRDPNQDWKINVRSFKPIAAGLFGDRAASRICRLGSLTSFATIDQAVRYCINAVIGFEQEGDLGAYIRASGQVNDLLATLGVSDKFGDLRASANRVFPSELLNATVASTGGYESILGSIKGVKSTTANIGGSITQVDESDLSSTITAVP